MSNPVLLKCIGTFAVFALSLVGYGIPFSIHKIQYLRYYTSESNWTDSSFFHTLKAFSSGVILGVALVHLIAESFESLYRFSDFPVAVTTTAVGMLFSVGIDQIALHSTGSSSHSHSGGRDVALSVAAPTGAVDESTRERDDSHELSPMIKFQIEAGPEEINTYHQGGRPISKLYILEAAIAIHSIIIGFGFGVMDSVETIKKAAALITAFSFHQFFEGIGLSTTVQSMLRHRQDRSISISFGLIFALTFPFGAIAGILSASDTYESQLLQGFANAFAGGVLLYTSLVEMVSVDFSNPKLLNRPALKACMFTSLICGFVLMAILAALE